MSDGEKELVWRLKLVQWLISKAQNLLVFVVLHVFGINSEALIIASKVLACTFLGSIVKKKKNQKRAGENLYKKSKIHVVVTPQ
jgi:hypothetical protein